MYIVDTNAISELRNVNSGRANLLAVQWSQSVSPSDIFLSAVTIFETEMGLLKIAQRGDEHDHRLRARFSDHVLTIFWEKYCRSMRMSR